jgi:hypothetical protein
MQTITTPRTPSTRPPKGQVAALPSLLWGLGPRREAWLDVRSLGRISRPLGTYAPQEGTHIAPPRAQAGQDEERGH